jgi:hypothetical protein
MKIRNGFVSNSSSSSFIIPKYKITEEQKYMILNSSELAKEIDNKLEQEGKEKKYEWYDKWDIIEDEISLSLSTSMDNFDLMFFIIEELGLELKKLIMFEDTNWKAEDIFNDINYINYKKLFLRKEKINKIKTIINKI